MLRNVKVGTKLLAILATPLLVILVLVTVGVRERLTERASAQRIEQLTLLATTTADYANQLQIEATWATAVAASRGVSGTIELANQREKTDAAADRFRDAVQRVDPSSDGEALATSVQTLDNRLVSLDQARADFAPGGQPAYLVAQNYTNAVDGLFDLNAALGQTSNDTHLLRSLSTMTALERIKQAHGELATQLIPPGYQGGFVDQSGARCAVADDCPSYRLAVAGSNALAQAGATFSELGTEQEQQLELNSQVVSRFNDLSERVLNEGSAGNLVTTPAASLTASSLQRLSSLETIDTTLAQSVVDEARALEEEASRAVMLYLLAGAAGMAVALAIAVVVSRSITGPLRRLTAAATRLSSEQLPALVEQMRNPDDERLEVTAESWESISIDSRDEIGRLADAFNSIQAVTVDVAQEQSKLLRKGIGDIFVNLARRNQSLLDRQIEFIDVLETAERDPDQLENLFRLDHLATRMRRNAESLLVMAGADPPRRRGAPVPVADVVRVAIGEVEDYQRVHLLALDDVTVATNVATDLAHLLSELMENATTASPPHTSVEVIGGYDESNGYVISIADRGIGMSEAQIAAANALLARPPMVGLAISRSLGLTVVSRLAARHGLRVRIDVRDEGGVAATVSLPYGLVEYPGEDSASTSPSPIELMAAVDGRPTRPRRSGNRPRPAPVPVPAGGMARTTDDDRVTVPDVVTGPVSAPVAPVSEPTPAGLPRRQPNPAEGAPAARGLAPSTIVSPAVAPSESSLPAAPAPAARTTTTTAAGLTRRTPVAARAQEAAAPARTVSKTSRSPEEVRRMLSRYRSGLDRGRTTPTEGTTSALDAATPPASAQLAGAHPAPADAVQPPADLPNRGAQE